MNPHPAPLPPGPPGAPFPPSQLPWDLNWDGYAPGERPPRPASADDNMFPHHHRAISLAHSFGNNMLYGLASAAHRDGWKPQRDDFVPMNTSHFRRDGLQPDELYFDEGDEGYRSMVGQPVPRDIDRGGGGARGGIEEEWNGIRNRVRERDQRPYYVLNSRGCLSPVPLRRLPVQQPRQRQPPPPPPPPQPLPRRRHRSIQERRGNGGGITQDRVDGMRNPFWERTVPDLWHDTPWFLRGPFGPPSHPQTNPPSNAEPAGANSNPNGNGGGEGGGENGGGTAPGSAPSTAPAALSPRSRVHLDPPIPHFDEAQVQAANRVQQARMLCRLIDEVKAKEINLNDWLVREIDRLEVGGEVRQRFMTQPAYINIQGTLLQPSYFLPPNTPHYQRFVSIRNSLQAVPIRANNIATANALSVDHVTIDFLERLKQRGELRVGQLERAKEVLVRLKNIGRREDAETAQNRERMSTWYPGW